MLLPDRQGGKSCLAAADEYTPIELAPAFWASPGLSPAMTVDREDAYGEGQTEGYIADGRCG